MDAGAKSAGKLGGFELGLMDVKTQAHGPKRYANYVDANFVFTKNLRLGGSYAKTWSPGLREVNFEARLLHSPNTQGVLQTQE